MLSYIEAWQERIMDTVNHDNFLHLLFLTQNSRMSDRVFSRP